jgi:hypothetical protein
MFNLWGLPEVMETMCGKWIGIFAGRLIRGLSDFDGFNGVFERLKKDDEGICKV